MNRLEWTIDGMTCGGCCGRLKRVLEQTDGVASAEITLETGQATIRFDPARVNAAVLQERVEGAGFAVRG
ncbi:heavy-metal-associated domain-containing protein [Dyella silvatica]|uniref:heavy-metal-associated domain-containing protein n=1 Tax=Dyella silvatica TaxID=2992128 RepID=UPI00225C2692|nr:heavy-metal-associated domain-containing protein [Dyella silvatica]